MTSERYEWTKLENHPIVVIELTGEIDSEKKTEYIEEIVAKKKTEHIALVMEDVAYINSKGCGRLVAIHKAVEDRGFHLYLVKTSTPAARVIKCLGIDNILRLVGGIDEVIREVEAQA